MKTFTDLEQSKKLAEILPIESADIFYRDNGIDAKLMWEHNAQKVKYPCWSLAALLDVLPKGEGKDTDLCFGGYKEGKYIPECFCSYEQQEPLFIEICHAPNPVDACYEMIINLHKQKLL